MKQLLLICLLICTTPCLFAQIKAADEAAIRLIIQKQEADWNKHDMDAFSQYFTDDATLINYIGMFWTDKKDILDHFHAFNDCCFVFTSIKLDFKKLRLISPDLAILYSEETIVADKDYDIPSHHYKKGDIEYKMVMQILIKKNNEWKITAQQLTSIDQGISPHGAEGKN